MRMARMVGFVAIGLVGLAFAFHFFKKPFEHQIEPAQKISIQPEPFPLPEKPQMLESHLLHPHLVFDFNQKDALRGWEEKPFLGHTSYKIEFQGAEGVLHSQSQKNSSAIFYRLKYNLHEYPYISWKWRAKKFPDKKSAISLKDQDDFPARLLVVFLSPFFVHIECIEYVWDDKLPEGATHISPFSSSIRQLVVQSGPMPDGSEWVEEFHNALTDYKRLFGSEPKRKVAAISLMTDSDGTQSESEAFYDDIQIGKEFVQ